MAATAINLLDDAEVRRRLNLSRPTLYRHRRDGLIPYVKVGHAIRYREDVIARIQREGTPRRVADGGAQ